VTDTSDRKRVLEALISAQETERGRISRDLHDQVGQALTALILGLSSAQSVEDYTHLKALASATLEDVRRISRDLRPALLDELGLEAAIKRFCRELAETKGFKVDVLVRIPEDLHQDIEIVIYRVVQEALTNVIRHAEASHASVVVTKHAANIQIIIEDNGHGFDPASPAINTHLGLAGMRERLELFGGSLTIESTLRKGTTVSGRLPILQDH
jgi:signal transduction histidine kinase